MLNARITSKKLPVVYVATLDLLDCGKTGRFKVLKFGNGKAEGKRNCEPKRTVSV